MSKYQPGAYWFGLSYEQDLAFASRLFGKTRRKYIEAVKKLWQVSGKTEDENN